MISNIIIGMFYSDISLLFLYVSFMAKYKILCSFTDLIKDIILRNTVLNKKYTLNHPITKYTLCNKPLNNTTHIHIYHK